VAAFRQLVQLSAENPGFSVDPPPQSFQIRDEKDVGAHGTSPWAEGSRFKPGLGSASGVALMTAVLRVRLDAHTSGLASEFAGGAIPAARLDAASLQAYAECFRTMAIAALIVSPGIFLFRPGAEARQIKKAA
jgi:hypothetical protein